MPVTEDTVPVYSSSIVINVLARASWFQTPHVLWPWVSWGPRPWFLNSVQGLLSCVPTQHLGPPRTMCPALTRPMPIQAVGHPSPGSVLLPCTPSPHPVYQLHPHPVSPHNLRLGCIPSQMQARVSPQLSPSFPLLSAGSRGLGLNPDSRLRGCETWDPLRLTFLICEMGMTGLAPLAGFVI